MSGASLPDVECGLIDGLVSHPGAGYCEIPAANRIDGGSSLDYLSSLGG
jgi:hypothetical protein